MIPNYVENRRRSGLSTAYSHEQFFCFVCKIKFEINTHTTSKPVQIAAFSL